MPDAAAPVAIAYVLRPLRPDEQAKLSYVLKQAFAPNVPNVPLDLRALEHEVATDDHMAGLTRLIRSGHDLAGATHEWERQVRRLRQPRQKSAAELAQQEEIRRSVDATRRRGKNWQPPAPVIAEPTDELKTLRAAVEKAEAALSDAEKNVVRLTAVVSKSGRDLILGADPAAKARHVQNTSDLAKARDLADAARATLDSLRGELAVAECDGAGAVRTRRLQEAGALAREYVEVCSAIDDALKTLNDISRVDAIVAQLEGFRDLNIFWPQSGRLLGDSRFDQAVSHAGASVAKLLSRDHVPVGRRKSLRQMAKAAFGALLEATAPQAE
jgi:hypothetical protein